MLEKEKMLEIGIAEMRQRISADLNKRAEEGEPMTVAKIHNAYYGVNAQKEFDKLMENIKK